MGISRKAYWWHLRGKASVKGEQEVCHWRKLIQTCVPLWAADSSVSLASWFCRCHVCLVTDYTSLFLTFSLVITVNSLLIPPRKGRTAGIHQSDAPSGCVWKPKPTCGEMDHASFLRLVGSGRAGGAVLPHLSTWGWLSGMQWWEALGQAGSGGPVGCPIDDGSSLGKVLGHIL